MEARRQALTPAEQLAYAIHDLKASHEPCAYNCVLCVADRAELGAYGTSQQRYAGIVSNAEMMLAVTEASTVLALAPLFREWFWGGTPFD